MGYLQLLDVLFISTVTAYLLTPFVKIMAVKFGYLDHPQDNKVHAHPTPLLGGVSIFVAFVTAVLTKEPVVALSPVKAMLLGALVLLAIGLIDDKMGMMPSFKLLGQFLAAMIIIKSGVRIECINNYYFSIIITYLWIIGITNSFNLLDNMNGLSAGIAAISALFFAAISFMNGQILLSAICCALAGSALGFLKHNFPKASIFMGDSGSLILGYVLSVIAILGSWKTYTMTTSLAVPILILGYPIFDTTLVSVMRIIEGRSIFQGGMDHSSHRIALLGFKRFRTVLIVYAVCILLGCAAVAVTKTHWQTGVAIVIGMAVFMFALGVRLAFVDTKRFGRKKISDEQR